MDKIDGGYLIGRIKLLSGRILNRLLTEEGFDYLSGEQGKILYSLWKRDGINCTAISEDTGLAINTLTNMLDLMQKRGLIYRVCCDKDKRKKLVFLTNEARSLETNILLLNKKMSDIFYKDFSDDEIAKFEKNLHKIANNLSEAQKRDK